MEPVFIIVACFITFFVLRAIIYAIIGKINKRKIIKSNQSITAQIAEVDNKFKELIIQEFEKYGWTDWKPSVHSSPGQLDRLKRASDPNSNIKLIRYNPKSGFAKIRGTKGDYYLVNKNRCSCQDFRNRQLPCKHMYFLVINLEDLDTTNFDNNNLLQGLCFSIVGRNQTTVKRFIEENGGTYGNDFWAETSAVVLASDMMTQRLETAMQKNVQILTFDELKEIF